MSENLNKLREMRDREPDAKLQIWLVPHGYEAKLEINGELAWSKGRSYFEDYSIEIQQIALRQMLYDLMDNVEKETINVLEAG